MVRMVLPVHTLTGECRGQEKKIITETLVDASMETEKEEKEKMRVQQKRGHRRKRFLFISFRAKLALRNSICFDILCMKYGYKVSYASVLWLPFHMQRQESLLFPLLFSFYPSFFLFPSSSFFPPCQKTLKPAHAK